MSEERAYTDGPVIEVGYKGYRALVRSELSHVDMSIRCTIGAASPSGRLFNATTFALAGRIAENPSITSRLHNVIDAMAN